MDRTRGNRYKLKHKNFHLDTEEHFFTVKMAEPWNRLLKGFRDFIHGDIQYLPGHDLGHLALAGPARSEGLN